MDCRDQFRQFRAGDRDCPLSSSAVKLMPVSLISRLLSAVSARQILAPIGVIVGKAKKYLANQLTLDVKDALVTARYRYFDPSAPALLKDGIFGS